MAATVVVATPDADAKAKKCKRGQLVVKVQGKKTCRARAKAFPNPRAGDARLSFLKTALGATPRGAKRAPKPARKAIAKLRGIAPQVLAKVDALRARARSAAEVRADCANAPDSSSTTSVGGATVTVSTSGGTMGAEMSVEANGYRVVADVSLGSECDGFKAPQCPTAAGALDGTDRNGYRLGVSVFHGNDLVSRTATALADRLTLEGKVADDAKLDTLEVTDKAHYSFTASGISADVTVRRHALIDMRTNLWLPEGASVNVQFLMHGGSDLGAAARAGLRDQLARDYDQSFPEIVGKEVRNYRSREEAWQEPNKCASLTFSPGSHALTLQEGQTGQFSATITAQEGGGHAKALADLSGQANAAFTPTHAEGDPATFSYTVTAAGGGKQVSATVRATSKAGVARDTWVQDTFKPLPPPPAFTGPISGTAEYDSHELGDGNSLSASWSGTVVLEQTTSPYPPGYPGTPTAVYKIRSAIIQYAYNGHVGGCTVVGSSPMDLASQPDIKDSVLLQLYDGNPRTYQFQIGMPLLLDDPRDHVELRQPRRQRQRLRLEPGHRRALPRQRAAPRRSRGRGLELRRQRRWQQRRRQPGPDLDLERGRDDLARLAGALEAAALDLLGDLAGEVAQRVGLLVRQPARGRVDDAQRPDREAVGREDRRARVEADVRVLGDEQVVVEALVLARVGDHGQVVGREDRVGAEREVAVGRLELEVHPRLEPLAGLVDERDDCDRRARRLGGAAHQLVELLLGLGVEKLEVVQRLETLLLVGG